MNLLWFIFILSVPVFYVWGLLSFVQNFFGKKDEPRKIETKLESVLKHRVIQEPEQSIAQFLHEYEIATGVKPDNRTPIPTHSLANERTLELVNELSSYSRSSRRKQNLSDKLSHLTNALEERAEQEPELSIAQFLEDYKAEIALAESQAETVVEVETEEAIPEMLVEVEAEETVSEMPVEVEAEETVSEMPTIEEPIARDELLEVMADLVTEAESEPVQVEDEAIMAMGDVLQHTSEVDYEAPEFVEESFTFDDEESFPFDKVQPDPEKKHAPQAVFSWHNWYADNSINLLLFLGAFLVVAAVSLFVTFNWQSFGGLTRFGIVVAFTVAWYVAGVGAGRFESLQTVSLTFVTIGAALTPFCGMAWHLFVGSIDTLGFTWLITSIITTFIYLGMSYIYQKSYFTYLGNLSILAMMLSLVQVTAAPQEYFILAGSITALITLTGRVLMRYAAQLEGFYGRDFEYSSMGTLAFSVVAGLILVPLRGMSYISIEVLAVTIVTSIYCWVYISVRINQWTVAAAHVLTTMATLIATLLFLPDTVWVLVLPVAVNIGIEYLLKWRLPEDYAEICLFASQLSIGINVLAYFAALFLYPDLRIVPLLVMLVIIVQFYIYALEHLDRSWFFVPVVLSYAFVAHLLYFLDISLSLWKFAFFGFAIVQVFLAYAPLKKPLRTAFLHIAVFALSVISLVSLIIVNEMTLTVNPVLDIGVAFASLFCLMLIVIVEGYTETPLLVKDAPLALSFVALVSYGLTWLLGQPYVSAIFMLQTGIMFFLAYQYNKNTFWLYMVALSSYVVLFHLVYALAIPEQYWSSIFGILALAQVALGYSKFQISVRRVYFNVGLLGLSALSMIAMLIQNPFFEYEIEFTSLGYMANLFTVLVSLSVFSVVLWIEGRSESELLPQTAPIIFSAVGLLCYVMSLPLGQHVTSAFIASLMGILFFLSYQHNKETMWLYLVAFSSYAVLFHIVSALGIHEQYWIPIFAVLALAQVALGYSKFQIAVRQVYVITGLLGLSVLSMLAMLIQYPLFEYEIEFTSLGYMANLLTVLVSLSVFSVIVWYESRSESELLPQTAPIILSAVGLICYLMSLPLGQHVTSTFIASLMGILFFLSYQHNKETVWLYLIALSSYSVLFHLVHVLGISAQYWSPIFAVLALAQVALGYSKFQIAVRQVYIITGLLGLSVLSMLAMLIQTPLFAYDIEFTLLAQMSNLFTVILSLSVFSVIVWYESRFESELLPAFTPVILSAVGLICYLMSVPLEQHFTSTFIVALMGILFFLVAYYHNIPNALYISAVAVYPFGYHLFSWIGIDMYLLPIVFVGLAVAQLFLAYRPLPKQVRTIFAQVSLIALAAISIFSLRLMSDYGAPDYFTTIGVITVYVTALAYIAFAFTEAQTENPLLTERVHLLTSFVVMVNYFILWVMQMYFVSAGLMFLLGILLALTYVNFRQLPLVYLAVVSPYLITINILQALQIPIETYPYALALVSVCLYIINQVLPEHFADFRTPFRIVPIAGLVLTSMACLGYGITMENSSLHIAGWVNAYTFLALLWFNRHWLGERNGIYIYTALVLGMYYWHIVYLFLYTNPELFGDVQWYSAGFGLYILFIFARELLLGAEQSTTQVLHGFALILFFAPTFYQIVILNNLAYALLGIIYSLVFVAVGIQIHERNLQRSGAIALVATLFIQSGDFLLSLPRWLIVGIVGLGLISSAVFLSVRRRTKGKDELQQKA